MKAHTCTRPETEWLSQDVGGRRHAQCWIFIWSATFIFLWWKGHHCYIFQHKELNLVSHLHPHPVLRWSTREKKKFANGDPLGCMCTFPKAQGRAASQVENVFAEWVTSPEHQVPQHWAYIILPAWTCWNGLSCPRWHLIPATQITSVHMQVLRTFNKQCACIKKSAYKVYELKHMGNPHYTRHRSILAAGF